MGKYEAKSYYQDTEAALMYESQFRSTLGISNLRVKLVGWGEQRAFSRLLNLVPSEGEILDIACGTGRYAEALLRRGYHVGGVDISSEMLKYAKLRVTHHPNLLFLRNGDAEILPFKTNEFDGITCMRLYHRVPPVPRTRMLQEVKRVGTHWAILSFGMSTRWLSLRRTIRDRVISGRSSNPYPVSLEEMREQLENTGFVVRDCVWILPRLADGMLVLVNW